MKNSDYCYTHSFGRMQGVLWWKNPMVHLAAPILISLLLFFLGPTLKNQMNILKNQKEAAVDRQSKHDALKSELKRAVGPRQLTDDQRHKMIDILKPLSFSSIEVQRRGELEAYNYANQIIEVFRSANWNVKVSGGRGGMSPPQYGIIWWTKDKNSPITQALRDALQVTGIPNSPHFVSDLGNDAAIRVGLKIHSDQ